MFFSFLSISPDPNTAPAVPGQPEASLWKRNVEVLKHTGVRGWQSGKNFFWLGLVWSGSECLIEKVRESEQVRTELEMGRFSFLSLRQLFLRFYRLEASQT